MPEGLVPEVMVRDAFIPVRGAGVRCHGSARQKADVPTEFVGLCIVDDVSGGERPVDLGAADRPGADRIDRFDHGRTDLRRQAILGAIAADDAEHLAEG